jgi:glycogen phosphorylase
MTRTSAPTKVKQHESSGFHFTDKNDVDSYDRYLVYDHVVTVEKAGQRERFEAGARSLRDVLLATRRAVPAT